MKNPKTIYELLEMLEELHKSKLSNYESLHQSTDDSRAKILLEFLAGKEKMAAGMVRQEMEHLDPEHCSYLTLGPTLNHVVAHHVDCQCGPSPTFDESLNCSFEPDELLEAILPRLESSSAAISVAELAERLREMETLKDTQISNFTRIE